MTPIPASGDPTEVVVYHFPSADDICRVALTFGVGWRDETVATQGVLHAIEHLVMYAARHTAVEVNASVDSMQTQFTASGTPELVASFLDQIGQALRDPAVDRLAVEARVLAAEAESEDQPSAPLHRTRYGFRDLGVRDAFPPAPGGISESLVTEWAHRWFVAGNAFLLVDGAYPDGVELALRPGVAAQRNWPAPRTWPRPHAVLVDGPACAVNLVLPPPDDSRIDAVAVAIIVNRVMETLRHDAGYTYVVDVDVTPIAGGRRDLVVSTEPTGATTVDAIRLLITTLSDLFEVGPSQQELTLAVERTVESTFGREAMITQIAGDARERLYGISTPRPQADLLRALDQPTVTNYLHALAHDVLYLASEEAEEALAELPLPVASAGRPATSSLPVGKVFRPSLLDRALSGEARRVTLVLTELGLVLEVEGEQQTANWSNVVGVARADDEMIVFTGDGAAIPVGPHLYQRGGQLIDAVTRNVPAHLIYPASSPETQSD